MIRCLLCVLAVSALSKPEVRGLNAQNVDKRVRILKSETEDYGKQGLEGRNGKNADGRRRWLDERVEVQSGDGWKNATDFGNSRCSKYCIVEETEINGARSARSTGNPFIGNILKFNFAKDELAEGTSAVFPIDCPISVSFNCEQANEDANSQPNADPKTEPKVGVMNRAEWSSFTKTTKPPTHVLMERFDQTGYTDAEFQVVDGTARIHIDIRGILSAAMLEVPTGTQHSDGVKVNARVAPAGEWRLKLLGVESSNYSVAVLASKSRVVDSDGGRVNLPNGKSRINARDNEGEESGEIGKSRLTQRIKPIIERSIDSESSSKQDQDGAFVFPTSVAYNSTPIARNGTSTNWNPSSLPQDIQDRSIASKEAEIQVQPFSHSNNITMRMVNAEDKQGFSEAEDLARTGEEDVIRKRGITIEVNVNTNLIVTPGTIHRTVFDVTNNHLESVRCFFKVRSTHFRIYNLQPVSAWIFAGQTSNVVADVVVPREISQDTINTISLFAEGSEVTEKSLYQYVQGWTTKINDDVKPTIEYSYNNNCAGKLDKDRCAKSRWSVDITVQDTGSGLKRVTSTPNSLVPRTDFITGTKSSVTFYYSSTCCSTTAKIEAIDLLNNYNVRTIDVTAWDNLSQGEIAAIVVGALLILLIIILLICSITYCVRSRRSKDLPYTQRYGSRGTPRAERTSF